MYTVFRARVFADIPANRLMTSVFVLIFAIIFMAEVLADSRTLDSPAGARFGRVSGGWSVNGKNRPAECCISQCGLHVIHPLPSKPSIYPRRHHCSYLITKAAGMILPIFERGYRQIYESMLLRALGAIGAASAGFLKDINRTYLLFPSRSFPTHLLNHIAYENLFEGERLVKTCPDHSTEVAPSLSSPRTVALIDVQSNVGYSLNGR